MAVLSVSDLKKAYPTKEIFERVSFQIEKREKVGLIGQNGSGKTTLFNVLTNKISFDEGKIFIPADVTVGYLKQQTDFESEMTVYDYCKKIFSKLLKIQKDIEELSKEMASLNISQEKLEEIMQEYQKKTDFFEKHNGYAINSEIIGTLKGLGFSDDEINKKISQLSGGQKARVSLAYLMLEKPDLILMDEPTNHLDMKAVNFLENFIRNFSGAVIVISHDRYFLDNTTTKTLFMTANSLNVYNGNYTYFKEQRKKELEILNHQYKNQQKEIERQKEIIERFKNLGGSKRKRGISQSKSRQKLLDKMKVMEKPQDDDRKISIRFKPRIVSGMDVLKAENLAKSYGNGNIFENLNFEIFRGERVALIGDNGVGKSTIFNIISGIINDYTGKITTGESVKIGYFDQEQKNLDLENTVVDEIRREYPKLTIFQIRSYLAKFMFKSEDVFRQIKELSGGEKARISLLKIMLSDANLILMDEPTNHLDISSKEILEDAILAYEGTVLYISHDRYFINRTATKVLYMENDHIEEYLGNFDYFIQKKNELEETEDITNKKTKTQIIKDRKKEKEKQKEISLIKKEVKRVEEKISKIEEEIKNLSLLTYDENFYEDKDNAKDILQKISKFQQEKEILFEKWMEISEKLEEITIEN